MSTFHDTITYCLTFVAECVPTQYWIPVTVLKCSSDEYTNLPHPRVLPPRLYGNSHIAFSKTVPKILCKSIVWYTAAGPCLNMQQDQIQNNTDRPIIILGVHSQISFRLSLFKCYVSISFLSKYLWLVSVSQKNHFLTGQYPQIPPPPAFPYPPPSPPTKQSAKY